MTDKLVLASKSPFRSALLKNAGIEFSTASADIDERAVEAPLYKTGATPEEVAQVLAEAKALDVSEKNPGAVVIGCDQTLSLGDEIFHKPADMEAARRQLLKFSGKTHQLNSAVVLVKDGKTLWRHVSIARMTMRDLDPGFVGRYLGRVGTSRFRASAPIRSKDRASSFSIRSKAIISRLSVCRCCRCWLNCGRKN